MKTKTFLFVISFLAIQYTSLGTNSIGKLSDESCVNDIPFNTAEIASTCLVDNNAGNPFTLEEEPYIDDIPFDTEEVVKAYHLQLAFQKEFFLTEETFVNDIPFDTWRLFSEYQLDQLAGLHEAYVNDIPFNTGLITALVLINSTELSLQEESSINDMPFCTEKILEAWHDCLIVSELPNIEKQRNDFCESIFYDDEQWDAVYIESQPAPYFLMKNIDPIDFDVDLFNMKLKLRE